LADYIRTNTDLQVKYSEGVVSILLRQKDDALMALEAARTSKLDWGDIRTRRDSLDDVFIKLVSGVVDERGEIREG
jgi:hypothetical protein